MLPSTADRVSSQTADEVNELMRQQSEHNIERCRRAGRAAVERRLHELDEEWDIERTLEANAATASLVGLLLGAVLRLLNGVR